MTKISAVHSYCPEKRDINAPIFEQVGITHVNNIKKGTLLEFHCVGCKTVIYILVETIK